MTGTKKYAIFEMQADGTLHRISGSDTNLNIVKDELKAIAKDYSACGLPIHFRGAMEIIVGSKNKTEKKLNDVFQIHAA